MQRTFSAFWMVLFLFVAPLHAEPNVYGEQRISGWWNALLMIFRKPGKSPNVTTCTCRFWKWQCRWCTTKKKPTITMKCRGAAAGRFPL